MLSAARFVIDTSVIVSAFILPFSVLRQSVDKAIDEGVLLFSEATLSELADVLFRQKLDGYVSREERSRFLQQLVRAAESVPIIRTVRECRDPKDDKFLEVALNGRADLIITGDADLLALNPWRNLEIQSPAGYLKCG
jgi:putative PIN family toxin of toxin-antitoxin system